MFRAFKYFTIQAGGTPQPLIGTYLTAAVTASQAAAAYNTSSQQANPITLTVADTSMFVGSTWLNIVDPGTYATERVLINSVTDSTHVVVQGLRNAHPGGAYGTGAWVALGDFGQDIRVQGLDGNTAALYVGAIPQMVKATGVGVIAKIVQVAANVQPVTLSLSQQGLANAETVSQFWIDGTTGDSYLPSIGAA